MKNVISVDEPKWSDEFNNPSRAFTGQKGWHDISVDRIISKIVKRSHEVTLMSEMEGGLQQGHAHALAKDIEKLKAELHSLLISKLPEKKPTNSAFEERKLSTPESAQNSAYNSAIDDVKAVLDEMFRSGDE